MNTEEKKSRFHKSTIACDAFNALADKQSQFYCVKLLSAAPCGHRLR